MMIAEAPPPPLQIPAMPFCPGFKLCTRCPVILAPDIPIGCPSETAPPWTLTMEGSSSMSLMLARTTTLKASLISKREMSSLVRSHWERILVMAATGAVGKSMGARAASAMPGGEGENGSLRGSLCLKPIYSGLLSKGQFSWILCNPRNLNKPQIFYSMTGWCEIFYPVKIPSKLTPSKLNKLLVTSPNTKPTVTCVTSHLLSWPAAWPQSA